MHITMKSKMPTYYFLTAFPQIVSRICHPSHETYLVLKSIIAKVFSIFQLYINKQLSLYVASNNDLKYFLELQSMRFQKGEEKSVFLFSCITGIG